MHNQELKQKTVKGVIWSSIETFGTSTLNFVFNIILARMLMPDDFGIIAILAFFIQLAQLFIDSGLSNALIRKQNRSTDDESTSFWCNTAIATIAYMLIFFSAPHIEQFYGISNLSKITRIYAIVIIINSFTMVHRSIITAEMNFKLLTKVSLTASIISGIIALAAAKNGLGVWALVILNLSYAIISNSLIWLTLKWKPKFTFSKKSFKELFGFGSKLLVSGIIDTTFNNLYALIIGKLFSTTMLGFYAKADSLSGFIGKSTTNVIQRVTYPSLSKIQDDNNKLQTNYRKVIRLTAYIFFPIMTAIATIADPLIRTLLTDKWADSIPLLQILCFAFMLYPIHALNLNLLQVKGRSDLFLKLEVIKKIVGTVILIVSMPFGITWICIGRVINSIIALTINTHYTGKLINIGFLKQITDMIPSIINSAIMAAICLYAQNLTDSPILKIITAIFFGFIYYICTGFILKSKELKEIADIIRNK